MEKIGENEPRLSNNSSLPSSSSTESGPSVVPNTQQATNQFKRINDSVYELGAGPNPKVDIVFLHGLPMNEDDASTDQAFWRIWTKRGSDECWPVTMLPECIRECLAYMEKDDDHVKYDPRVLAVSYKSRLELPSHEGNTTDEYNLSENLTLDLILGAAAVGQERPVILVGHDLGGIVIKQLILFVESKVANEIDSDKSYKLKQFLKNLGSVFFYSTPHWGSPAIERVATKIPLETQNPMLHLMSVLSKEMSRVNQDFYAFRLQQKSRSQLALEVETSQRSLPSRDFATFALNASYTTNKGYFKGEQVCLEASARSDIDDYYSVPADHYDVCRPEANWSNSMKLLAQDILRVVDKFEPESLDERHRSLKEFAGVAQTPLPELS